MRKQLISFRRKKEGERESEGGRKGKKKTGHKVSPQKTKYLTNQYNEKGPKAIGSSME